MAFNLKNYLIAAFTSLSLYFMPIEAVNLDFDTDSGGGAILTGQVIDNEYLGFGVSISVTNLGGGPNLGIAFNSNMPTGGDPDLLTPNPGGHPTNIFALNNVLIIQEQGSDSMPMDGFLDVPPAYGPADGAGPDDEAGGGFIEFLYSSKQLFTSIDVLDIEEQGGSVEFFDGIASVGILPFAPLGNASFQRVMGNISPFDRIRVTLVGSGAIDNINTMEVPEVETWLMMGSFLTVAGVLRTLAKRKKIY